MEYSEVQASVKKDEREIRKKQRKMDFGMWLDDVAPLAIWPFRYVSVESTAWMVIRGAILCVVYFLDFLFWDEFLYSILDLNIPLFVFFLIFIGALFVHFLVIKLIGAYVTNTAQRQLEIFQDKYIKIRDQFASSEFEKNRIQRIGAGYFEYRMESETGAILKFFSGKRDSTQSYYREEDRYECFVPGGGQEKGETHIRKKGTENQEPFQVASLDFKKKYSVETTDIQSAMVYLSPTMQMQYVNHSDALLKYQEVIVGRTGITGIQISEANGDFYVEEISLFRQKGLPMSYFDCIVKIKDTMVDHMEEGIRTLSLVKKEEF